MTYKNICYEERKIILRLHKSGKTNSEIARRLGKHRSTIGRELKRNSSKHGYLPRLANDAFKQRKSNAIKKRKLTNELKAKIKQLIKARLTAKEVVDYLSNNLSIRVHVSTIYRYIHEDYANRGTLVLRLRKRTLRRYGCAIIIGCRSYGNQFNLDAYIDKWLH